MAEEQKQPPLRATPPSNTHASAQLQSPNSSDRHSNNNEHQDVFFQVPSRHSISDRRGLRGVTSQRRQRGIELGLRVPSRRHDSYRVTDTSYTRQNIRIDHQGIQSQDNDEQKSLTPKIQSFIKDISEVHMLDALGSGQSGYVSQAIHIPTQKMLAIKKISVYEKSRRHQIMNEFHALENAKCNGLVEFYGIFFYRGSVLIALEYCECGSLYDIMNKVKRIPEAVLAKICIDILDGLDFLHTHKKQIHRDLKPSNICLNARGQAKVTDFGISRELKDSFGAARSYVGTHTYMSPERIRAEAYSFESDIWALGLTLMTCAIGKYPYPQSEFYIEMIQYITTEPPPLLPKNMNFSAEFQDFLNQCINKDPSKRADAKSLKQHAWIRKNMNVECDVVKWIKQNDLIIHIPSMQEIAAAQQRSL
eukprot:CAMPEP_0197046476 /NCGR_PEP_ID=MMETSP1384-20130603/22185_1 /TAXON_ID=29189 /ORGANISM="Ammonia sp." /LENGTH=419 /DNA_ID=CAMNT_0042478281 /DNA_START=105 /DNA_END=1364 /DNA_ORIENTATION=-